MGTAVHAMSWMLTGNDDLQKHVGHKIQVTGKTTWDSSMDHNRASASTCDGLDVDHHDREERLGAASRREVDQDDFVELLVTTALMG